MVQEVKLTLTRQLHLASGQMPQAGSLCSPERERAISVEISSVSTNAIERNARARCRSCAVKRRQPAVLPGEGLLRSCFPQQSSLTNANLGNQPAHFHVTLAREFLFRTLSPMSLPIESLHIGMKVRHPRYGVGVIKALTEHTADISFEDAPRTVAPESSDLSPADPTARITELQIPLNNLIRETAHAVVEALGLQKRDAIAEGIARRWERGTLTLKTADASLQAKEVPIETFFHKIVMIRNNLRVLEQKVNASDKLSDGDKVELQQYITRCYGSLTTFNILFKNKEDQFSTS
jgi:hypothetical protein